MAITFANMKKYILIFLLSIIAQLIIAQEIGLIVRPYGSIGFEKGDVDYGGVPLEYSPGGGFGLETGLEYKLDMGFAASATIGYQGMWTFYLTTGTGGSNKSSFSFDRKYFTGNIHQLISLSDGIVEGINIGGGASYNIPEK